MTATNTLSGYVMHVRNKDDKEFLYWPSYGPTPSKSARNMRNAVARQIEHRRDPLRVIGMAFVAVTVQAITPFAHEDDWRDVDNRITN